MGKIIVACIPDIAQRAFDVTGEPTELSATVETLDGIVHVRLNTDPVTLLLPLSAFRVLSDWITSEAGSGDPANEIEDRVARAIYAVELARDDNCNSLIVKMGGNPHPSTRIEAYEENAESWREYARAALQALGIPAAVASEKETR